MSTGPNLTAPANLAQARDDVWIPSTCALCYGNGVSGIMSHYDPNRLTKPMRRTNPKKGLNEDPRWKEISWDEALDEIATVLKRVRAEDPRKLLVQRTTTVTA